MTINYLLSINADELNTIGVSLHNVQVWHRQCIEQRISVKDHEELIEKTENLRIVIAEFLEE